MNKLFQFFVNAWGGFFDKRLWQPVGTSRATTAKVDVSEDSALNYAAVWCATRILCGTGAKLDLWVYRDEGKTRKVLEAHPVSMLLNVEPNPEMDAFNFRSVMWQWQVNWGNAYAEIVREGDNPGAPVVELWPLHPSRVKVCRDEAGRLYYEINEFGGPPTELEPWQMLHLPSIITYDGIVGRGVIQHARETIGAGIAAEHKAAHRFGDGNIPAIVVEHPGKWPDEVRNAFRKEWKELYGGSDGDTVALLQGGATAKPLQGFSERDSQFLESRQFDIEEIARWYGIPPHLLHHLLRATFNNIEELGIDFLRYSLDTWLTIWEKTVRRKLFTEREQDLFVEHDVDELTLGTAQSRAEFYGAMTGAAIMQRNEARVREGLDPVPGGDTFLVQGAMVPLDADGKPESDFAQPAGKPSGGPPPQSEQIAASLERVISRDLSRMLTKEAKAITAYAQKPQNFVGKVDDFYASHRDLLIDVLDESVGALNLCGRTTDSLALAGRWVSEGKALILEAAGAATPNELPEAVKRVIESKTWSERPHKALEKAGNHATSLVRHLANGARRVPQLRGAGEV